MPALRVQIPQVEEAAVTNIQDIQRGSTQTAPSSPTTSDQSALEGADRALQSDQKPSDVSPAYHHGPAAQAAPTNASVVAPTVEVPESSRRLSAVAR